MLQFRSAAAYGVGYGNSDGFGDRCPYCEDRTLHKADREERLQRAKAISRIAYRIVRNANLVGVREMKGEERNLREFRRGLLFIDLYEPSRLAADAGFSRLRISYNCKKVFEIRWDATGTCNVILFEGAVEWIGSLARAKDAIDTA